MWGSINDVRQANEEMECLDGEWPEGGVRNWESISQVSQRVSTVFSRYVKLSRVAVICHEIVIKSLTGYKLDFAECIEYTFLA